MSETEYPLELFRFQVEFERVPLGSGNSFGAVDLCKGAFAECSGLDATMEPKVIKAGGWNYGAFQRTGPVTFGTVILKRGITSNRDLWKWFSQVNQKGRYAFRLNITIRCAGPGEDLPGSALTVRLYKALPVKFRCADPNARTSDISIEELHLAHEGLTIE